VKRIDTFPYGGEADMLECRLTEMSPCIDRFVIVEADVTHGGNTPKPYRFLEQQDRFAPWMDRIVYVQATDLPDLEDAWSRELAQREWVWEGLRRIDAQPDDIVLHGDVDEIPTVLAASMVRPRGAVVFNQRFHPFAVDWVHPRTGDRGFWDGTVAVRVKDIDKFADVRNARLAVQTPGIPDAGWHLSWVSDGIAQKEAKIRAFCHTEIRPTWESRMAECYAAGRHVDGAMLEPAELVDGQYQWRGERMPLPRWVEDGHAPAGWYRPRERAEASEVTEVPDIKVPFVLGVALGEKQ
jgi:beta-1,4-mannosyl-glycoprotein beta-1,4-N-acetylglucosaminyltransferase